MTIPFTLLYAGVEKSLADWGLDDLEFDWANLAPHYVTFTAGGRAIDAASIFPYGATVEIWKDRSYSSPASYSGGSRWFYGRVEPWDLVGGGGREDQIGRLVNPWWYLEHIIYKMVYTQTQNNVVSQYVSSRVILNILFNPATAQPEQVNTGAQITAALAWAIANGAPITIGKIAPWAYPATDFQKNITCAEVIHKMWRIESDFCVVWDYTTLPYPTIHCLKGSTANLDPSLNESQKSQLVLSPVNIDLNAGNWLDKVHIKPRPDWQMSYVNIDYDQINRSGSQEYLALGNDHYPDPIPNDTESRFRGVDLYFDLAGAKVASSQESGTITTAPFDITLLAQWQKWKHELNAPNIKSAVIIKPGSNPPPDANHPVPAIVSRELDANGDPVAYNGANSNELLDGNYCDWMGNAPLNISAQKVRAAAWVLLTLQDGSKKFKQVSCDFTAISLNTAGVATEKFVNTSNVQEYAEPQPVGLARAIYLAWQSLAAEGSITSIEEDLAGLIGFGNCLNFLTPLQPAWAALNAVVQTISGSARRGVTNVRFGAPLHLTAAQLVDLLRVTRFRIPSVDLNFLFGGPLTTGGGKVRHSRKSHARSAEHGADHQAVLVAAASANPAAEINVNNQGTVTLDATPSVNPDPVGSPPRAIAVTIADLDGADNKGMKIRIWRLPVAGQLKNVGVMSTDVPDNFICFQ
jgi:hypothetical protein